MITFSTISLRQALAGVAGFSALALGLALVAQYGYGLHPCDLCLYQRVPYGLIMLVGAVGLRVSKPKTQRLLLALCAALFLADAVIAAYHTGVELGIFTGPSACSGTAKPGQTLEELRAAILHAPLVSCAQAMAYFLGLSMAAWNAIVATGAFIATSTILYKSCR